MSNATRRLAILVVLSFALRHSMHGQNTTTDTNCTVNGNTANCTSTSTDDSAQRQARAAAQAEQDRANEQAGAAVGKAMGTAMNGLIVGHRIKSYCKKHPGETWALSNNNTGEVYNSGQCPEPNRQAKQAYVPAYVPKKLDDATQAVIDERDRLSSRAQQARSWRTQAGCESEGFIWGNGNCGTVTGHIATADTDKPSASTQRETYCRQYPRGVFREDDGSLEYCDVRDDPANQVSAAAPVPTGTTQGEPVTVTKAAASNIPQSAPAVAPAHPSTAPADRQHCWDVLANENFLVTAQEELSSPEWTDLELCRMSATMLEIDQRVEMHTLGVKTSSGWTFPYHSKDFKVAQFWKDIQKKAIPLWFDVRDAFCEFHSSAQYIDTFGNVEHCPETKNPIHMDRKSLSHLLDQSLTLDNNVGTFASSEDAEALQRSQHSNAASN
jgi:hypothetical protein